MYSVVLATVLAMGSDAPTFGGHHRGHGHGCWGCHGCRGCHGCHGCHGYNAFSSCHGCFGCSGCYGGSCHGCWGGCSGCYGGSCYGCWGGSCHGCFGGCCGGFTYSAPVTYGCCGGCYGGCCGGVVAAPSVAVAPVIQQQATTFGAVPAAQAVPSPAAGQIDALNQRVRRIEDQLNRLVDALNKQQSGSKSKASIDALPAVARITVNVPADARLWVDHVECPLTSAVRSFDTPALEPGQTYAYTMTVEVNRDGQTVRDSQRVRVTAGQQVNVDFTTVGGIATASR